jgi:hypothetical protein
LCLNVDEAIMLNASGSTTMAPAQETFVDASATAQSTHDKAVAQADSTQQR